MSKRQSQRARSCTPTPSPLTYRHALSAMSRNMDKKLQRSKRPVKRHASPHQTGSKHPTKEPVTDMDVTGSSRGTDDHYQQRTSTPVPEDDALLDDDSLDEQMVMMDTHPHTTTTPLDTDLARLSVNPSAEPHERTLPQQEPPCPPPRLPPPSSSKQNEIQEILRQNAFPEEEAGVQQQHTRQQNQQTPPDGATVFDKLLHNRRQALFNLEKVEHHHSYLSQSLLANVLPTWLQTSQTNDIRPMLAHRTNIMEKINQLTMDYHTHLATAVKDHYQTTMTQLKEDLTKIDVDMTTAMEHIAPNESNTILKTVTDSVVETRDELTARRRASHQRRLASIRNLKRRRQDGDGGGRDGDTAGPAKRRAPRSHSPLRRHSKDWDETWREKHLHKNDSNSFHNVIHVSLTPLHRTLGRSQGRGQKTDQQTPANVTRERDTDTATTEVQGHTAEDFKQTLQII